MSLNKKTYYALLDTPMWNDFRTRIIRERNNTCELCGKTLDYGLQVHHRCYYTGRKPWEYIPDEVMCLCVDCHQSLHLDLARHGDRIPVQQDEKETGLTWSASLCRHCNGFGIMEEFPYILGGLCIYCFGAGERYIHRFSDFEIKKYAEKIYLDWLEYHQNQDGVVDSYKFTSEKDIEKWLRAINDMKG